MVYYLLSGNTILFFAVYCSLLYNNYSGIHLYLLTYLHRQMPFKDDRINRAINSKNNVNAFPGSEWMKEHNYALPNADSYLLLQSRMQNICFVILISAVILKVMVKITSFFSSYRFLRIARHDIFSLSHHLLASWNLRSRRANAHLLIKFNTWTSQRLLKSNQWSNLQVNHCTHLKDSCMSWIW